jgi:hypothetical protein
MDLSAINMDLSALPGSNLIGSNFAIVIGIFVTLSVMGVTAFYDRYKKRDENLAKNGKLKPSLGLNQKIKDFSSKYMSNFSGISKKFSGMIPKKEKKYKLENSEIKTLKPTSGIPKIFGTIKSKISSFSFNLRHRNKYGSEKAALRPDMNQGTSKPSGNEKVSGFDVDKLMESKKDELDFDDSVLTEMSTEGGLKNNKTSSLNADLSFDKEEFDIGFGAISDESFEEDSLFNTGAEKIALADERDNLLDSLKKDIVVSHEKKINFMTDMQGENLDLKIMKSDLEDVLKKLKKYKQYSSQNHS